MDKIKEEIDNLVKNLEIHSKLSLGYPSNGDFDYTDLYPLLRFPINNIGNPFVEGNYQVNTFKYEREVVNFFQKLVKAKEENTSGYVTNGGTEGNLYGLLLAREKYPDGIVYYSKDTHYSVHKIIKLLRVNDIVIDSTHNGEIDYQALSKAISASPAKPAIISANIGTAMKGATDDIEKIKQIVKDVPYYIHADAALSGMILPFVANPPSFTFPDGINSIAISGHKFIGSPIPCGIVVAENENIENLGKTIEYIASVDTTISGSRNGVTPMFLWYAINKLGIDEFKQKLSKCFNVADYAIKKLTEIGIKAWRNPNSITVVLEKIFEKVNDDILKKYQIASQGDIGHIIVVPDVSEQIIDNLIGEIRAVNHS